MEIGNGRVAERSDRRMKRALVIGASGGIGRALVEELSRRGTEVATLSRRQDGFDLTDENSVRESLSALSGPFDAILVATGALQIDGYGPEKALRQISARGLADQFAVNAIGPALILKHGVRLLPRESRAVFAVLSARVGSIGDNRLGGWYSYRASKAALNQIIRSAAIEIARTHKQALCVALHPGTVATPFTADFVEPKDAVPPDSAARNLLNVIDGLTPEQTGAFFDHAGKPVPW